MSQLNIGHSSESDLRASNTKVDGQGPPSLSHSWMQHTCTGDNPLKPRPPQTQHQNQLQHIQPIAPMQPLHHPQPSQQKAAFQDDQSITQPAYQQAPLPSFNHSQPILTADQTKHQEQWQRTQPLNQRPPQGLQPYYQQQSVSSTMSQSHPALNSLLLEGGKQLQCNQQQPQWNCGQLEPQESGFRTRGAASARAINGSATTQTPQQQPPPPQLQSNLLQPITSAGPVFQHQTSQQSPTQAQLRLQSPRPNKRKNPTSDLPPGMFTAESHEVYSTGLQQSQPHYEQSVCKRPRLTSLLTQTTHQVASNAPPNALCTSQDVQTQTQQPPTGYQWGLVPVELRPKNGYYPLIPMKLLRRPWGLEAQLPEFFNDDSISKSYWMFECLRSMGHNFNTPTFQLYNVQSHVQESIEKPTDLREDRPQDINHLTFGIPGPQQEHEQSDQQIQQSERQDQKPKQHQESNQSVQADRQIDVNQSRAPSPLSFLEHELGLQGRSHTGGLGSP